MRKTLLHGGYRPKRDSRTITDPSTTPTPTRAKNKRVSRKRDWVGV